MHHLCAPIKSTAVGLHDTTRALAVHAVYTQERVHKRQKQGVVVVSSRTVNRPTDVRVTKLRELVLRAVAMKNCDEALELILEMMKEISGVPFPDAQIRPGHSQLESHKISWNLGLHSADVAKERLGLVMKGQHENVMRACLAAGRLDLGLKYWSLLPAKPAFFSTMLRLTLLYGTAEDVQEVVQVR